MPDALHYLETMTTLAEFAATGPEAITMAMGSTNITPDRVKWHRESDRSHGRHRQYLGGEP